MPALCCVTWQRRVTSPSVPFSYDLPKRRKSVLPTGLLYNDFLFLFLFLRKLGGYIFLNNQLKSEAFTRCLLNLAELKGPRLTKNKIKTD